MSGNKKTAAGQPPSLLAEEVGAALLKAGQLLPDLSAEEETNDIKHRSLEQEEFRQETGVNDKDGYGRAVGRDFNPLTNEHETRQEIEKVHEAEAEHDHEHSVEPRKKRSRFVSFLKVVQKGMYNARESFLAIKQMRSVESQSAKQQADKTRGNPGGHEIGKKLSFISHSAKHSPGDQAGIFDQKEVAAKRERGTQSIAGLFRLDKKVGAALAEQEIGLLAKRSEAPSETMSKAPTNKDLGKLTPSQTPHVDALQHEQDKGGQGHLR